MDTESQLSKLAPQPLGMRLLLSLAPHMAFEHAVDSGHQDVCMLMNMAESGFDC